MVFSDDFLHFLKIKKEICRIHQNYLVALNLYKYTCTDLQNNSYGLRQVRLLPCWNEIKWNNFFVLSLSTTFFLLVICLLALFSLLFPSHNILFLMSMTLSKHAFWFKKIKYDIQITCNLNCDPNFFLRRFSHGENSCHSSIANTSLWKLLVPAVNHGGGGGGGIDF